MAACTLRLYVAALYHVKEPEVQVQPTQKFLWLGFRALEIKWDRFQPA